MAWASPERWEVLRASLLGQDSKIWLLGKSAFHGWKERRLCPPRWRDKAGVGTCIVLPCSPKMDIKGTFIAPGTGEVWIDNLKKDRHQCLHRTGHT